MFTSVLALFIALHGFLLVIGGPRAVKGMYRLLARSIFPFPRRGSRGLTSGFLNVLATVIRFVFDRPRR
jgi:hypothetical protein